MLLLLVMLLVLVLVLILVLVLVLVLLRFAERRDPFDKNLKGLPERFGSMSANCTKKRETEEERGERGAQW